MPTRAQRRAAGNAINRAKREGRLSEPEACESCGVEYVMQRSRYGVKTPLVIWHHWSYEPEHLEDVIALCRKCHAQVHFGTRVEPRTGRMYSRERAKLSSAWKQDPRRLDGYVWLCWRRGESPPFVRRDMREASMARLRAANVSDTTPYEQGSARLDAYHLTLKEAA